ncbi:extracellular solute-binding protein, partial [Collinsella sp. BIOML-A4]|uniref:ABC transporter substrate-binding protein n=1 Tax=Collinsella sp. BIOML-A4 TaxID=2584631 RepID=UPI00195A4601
MPQGLTGHSGHTFWPTSSSPPIQLEQEKRPLPQRNTSQNGHTFWPITRGTAGDDGGKKEISFQTWNLKNDKYTPYFEALIKAYEKDHPDVTVKWLDAPSDGYEDKLSSQAAAGELPDIVDGGNSILYGLAKAGALLDVSKQAPDAEKDYYEGAWKSVTMQGNGVEKGAYGLPW